MLGIVALLVDTHYVKSNRESDYGRFDVMLIPKDKSNVTSGKIFVSLDFENGINYK